MKNVKGVAIKAAKVLAKAVGKGLKAVEPGFKAVPSLAVGAGALFGGPALYAQQNQVRYYEGPIVSSYPGEHNVPSHRENGKRIPEKKISGTFYIVDTDGNLPTTQDRKRMFLGDVDIIYMPSEIKEGDVIIFSWDEWSERRGYSFLPPDLVRLTSQNTR
jgi:hypothetical protein